MLGEVEGWLAACDLVKFAKVSPSAAEARGALESAIRIVTTTRPAPVAAVAPAGARHAEAAPCATGKRAGIARAHPLRC